MRRILTIAAAGSLLLLSSAAAFAQQPATPERSNKAGEVRGKERADQVKGQNEQRRSTAEKAKPEKAKGEKAAKADKAKKG
jgi:hypothetical protein